MIEVPAPTLSRRIALIKHYLPQEHACSERDICYIACWTNALSARAVKHIVEEAKALAAEQKRLINYYHLRSAAEENGVSFSWLKWYMPKIEINKENKETWWQGIQFAAPLIVSIAGICIQSYQTYKASQENQKLHAANKELQMKLHNDNLLFQADMQKNQMQFQVDMSKNQLQIQQKLHDQGMEAQEKAYDFQSNVGFWGGIPIVGPMIGSWRHQVSLQRKEDEKKKLALEQGQQVKQITAQ